MTVRGLLGPAGFENARSLCDVLLRTTTANPWEAAPHSLFNGFAPEDRERDTEIQRFIEQHIGAPTPKEA
ncbi:hypothetical protein [Streptosporangium sp. NPDC002607]